MKAEAAKCDINQITMEKLLVGLNQVNMANQNRREAIMTV